MRCNMKESFYSFRNVFRTCGRHSSNFIGYFFIVSHSKPTVTGITCTRLQDRMNLFDELFAEYMVCVTDGNINATEMV